MNYINSVDNKNIKEVKKLMEKKERFRAKKYVIEGEKLIEDAIESRAEFEKFLVSESFYKKSTDFMIRLNSKNDVYVLKDNLFKAIKTTETTQGILAVVKMPLSYFQGFSIKNKKFLLILEDIQDPGNMGTIIRTADAFGVDGLLVSNGCVDIYNPKVVRSTMGGIFRVPICKFDKIEEIIVLLKGNGIEVYASSLETKNSIESVIFNKKTALIIGNESNGVSKKVLKEVDKRVKIPISEKTDSLNAAVATGILVYEIKRQIGK